MALPNPRQLARSLAEQGDTSFENFIASMLIEEYPGATQTNPGGGGDGGIDVSYETDKGLAVWQIKNFYDPLTSSQMQQVKNSITRLAGYRDDHRLTLAEYYLVTAWTPNTKRLRSFHAKASVLGCPAVWHGEAKIRALIAKHPAIYDRLIHGEGHLERFVTERALLAGTSPGDPGLPGFSAAVVDRQRSLKELEGLQTGSYKVMTTHATIAASASIDELVRNLDGVMHQVSALGDGAYEVRSAVPNPASGGVEPITLHATISQEELESNESARDFVYWGKTSAEFDLESRLEGGPFAEEWPTKGLMSLYADSMPPADAPPVVMRLQDNTGVDQRVLRLDIVEATSGFVGGGKRLVAVSRGGALRLELRWRSSSQPDLTAVKLETQGGQRPSEILPELEALAAVSGNDIIAFSIGPTEFATLTMESPSEAAAALEVIARALCEWDALSETRLLMPRLSRLTPEDVRGIERIRLALRGEGETLAWRDLRVTIRDPVRAIEEFSQITEGGALVITRNAELNLGDVIVRLPRVLTECFTGIIRPTPSELEDLKEGDSFVIRGTETATLTWGMVHDDAGRPVTKWPPEPASA